METVGSAMFRDDDFVVVVWRHFAERSFMHICQKDETRDADAKLKRACTFEYNVCSVSAGHAGTELLYPSKAEIENDIVDPTVLREKPEPKVTADAAAQGLLGFTVSTDAPGAMVLTALKSMSMGSG